MERENLVNGKNGREERNKEREKKKKMNISTFSPFLIK